MNASVLIVGLFAVACDGNRRKLLGDVPRGRRLKHCPGELSY